LEDIKLLETTDALHRRLNSAATKEILRREAKLFGHNDYNRISKISTSHINNLRHSNTYHKFWVNGTKAGKYLLAKLKSRRLIIVPEALGLILSTRGMFIILMR